MESQRKSQELPGHNKTADQANPAARNEVVPGPAKCGREGCDGVQEDACEAEEGYWRCGAWQCSQPKTSGMCMEGSTDSCSCNDPDITRKRKRPRSKGKGGCKR
jgi:hypothetical protein